MTIKYEVIRLPNKLVYRRHDEVHRDEGPAVVYHDEIMSWFKYGMLKKINKSLRERMRLPLSVVLDTMYPDYKEHRR